MDRRLASLTLPDPTQAIQALAARVEVREEASYTARYPAEQVNPPEGIKSSDWIKNGFKK